MGGVALPSWLTSEDAECLSGGAGEGNIHEDLNLAGFKNKLLQNDIEVGISNNFPIKASLVLSDAALQRGFIAASNSLFDWSCYPTYYSSERLYYPEQDSLAVMPQTDFARYDTYIGDFMDGLGVLAEKYPNKNFVVYFVQGYFEPAVNPAYDLVSNPVTAEKVVNYAEEVKPDLSNVYVVSVGYDNPDDYYKEYFKTDHHWNILGSIAAYNEIGKVLGWDAINNDEVRYIDNYEYSGSAARWGKDLISEDVFDSAYELPEMIVHSKDGAVIKEADDRSAFYVFPAAGRKYKFYDSYYDSYGNEQYITGGVGDSNLLLVGNSFAGAIYPYLAQNYKSAYLSNGLHPSASDTSQLDSLIADTDAKDIVFIANPGDYTNLMERLSNYFDIGN